jgi:hypothetical protein
MRVHFTVECYEEQRAFFFATASQSFIKIRLINIVTQNLLIALNKMSCIDFQLTQQLVEAEELWIYTVKNKPDKSNTYSISICALFDRIIFLSPIFTTLWHKLAQSFSRCPTLWIGSDRSHSTPRAVGCGCKLVAGGKVSPSYAL